MKKSRFTEEQIVFSPNNLTQQEYRLMAETRMSDLCWHQYWKGITMESRSIMNGPHMGPGQNRVSIQFISAKQNADKFFRF